MLNVTTRRSYRLRRLLPCILLLLLLANCTTRRGQQLDDLPTQATIDDLATATYLTENAPPEGFRGEVSFPEVDAGLNQLPGWRYVVYLEFNGAFARTPRETEATASAEVWFNQLGTARRVVVSTSGELIGREEDTQYEAVRLGPDAFLVRDNICLGNAGPDAQTAADLRAGQLVGGVNRATPTGLRATLNGEEAWQYAFTASDLNLPAIRLSDEGQLTLNGGEIWVAPEHNAVVRFYVNLEVTNAIIFDRQLPVTGQVIIRYDLYDIGVVPNITVPFGC
jgi:hypothetical protein